MRENNALTNINISIPKGEFLILTGDSGSGKSTICYSLLGLLPHFYSGNVNGKIIFKNKNLLEEDISNISQEIGYIPQRTQNTFVTPLVITEIAFPLEYSSNLKNSEKEVIEIINSTIAELNLTELTERKINQLSEGEKQLVAIGSAIVRNPNIIVADEPLANLDKKNRQILLKKFQHFHKLGKTIIIATHEYDEYLDFVDRIIEIENGTIVGDSKTKTFKEKAQIQLSNRSSKQVKRRIAIHENTDTHLRMINIDFKYSDTFQINKVNLGFQCGAITGLVGDNGSGKTTYLKLLCGILKPIKGQIKILDEDIKTLNWNTISQKFGIVFQDPEKQFFEDTSKEEIALISRNIGRSIQYKEISSLLKDSGLNKYDEYNPHSLSHGEKRRLVFISATYHEPEVIIIDEITNGMDEVNKNWLENQLYQLKMNGKTIIVISHDWKWLKQFADRIVYLEKGQVKSVFERDQFTNLDNLLSKRDKTRRTEI